MPNPAPFLLQSAAGYREGIALLAYISRRFGILLVILFGSSFILYNLTAISGDPLESLRGNSDPRVKLQMINLIRTLKLNVPPPARYFLWLKGVLSGDFGRSRAGNSVAHALATAIPITIRLVTMATIIAIILGIGFGIVSALRQYTRFDYVMTFFAFLMYSLPIFWVAVLLKQYLAISFNNFLGKGEISPYWILPASLVSGIFWAGIISGSRKKVLTIFGIAAFVSAGILEALSISHWFTHPTLAIYGVTLLSIGAAFALTYLSTGLQNRAALYSSLITAGSVLVTYFPIKSYWQHHGGYVSVLLFLLLNVLIAVGSGFFLAKEDKGPVYRTGILTSILITLFMFINQLFLNYRAYVSTDAINYRPVPTISEANSLLTNTSFWFTSLDTLLHLFLPTLALCLISFASYVRYSRGTLLEVLNQDYIRTARAKGLPERTVIMRHAFRNTLIPLTTIIVVDLAGIIGGAIITESVFGWRGMGTLFNDAIRGLDLNLLMGVFLVTASLSVLANLVADLLYSYLDPRIRVVGGGK